MLSFRLCLIHLLMITFSSSLWAQQAYVDSMIIIAVDVSGSISSEEYEIQKEGIVNALLDPSVQNLLNQCSNDGIGMTYLEWSGQKSFTDFSHADQSIAQVIPWTYLHSPQGLQDFAHAILKSKRSSAGDTDIAEALNFSGKLFLRAPFQSDRKIISLSTDGRQGLTVAGVPANEFLKRERDALAVKNITINAIAIDLDPMEKFSIRGIDPQTEESDLSQYLENNVKTGAQSFVIKVSDINAYAEAFKKQIKIMLNACIS